MARMDWKKVAALSAVFLGNIDRHQAELEEFLNQVLAEDAGLVH